MTVITPEAEAERISYDANKAAIEVYMNQLFIGRSVSQAQEAAEAAFDKSFVTSVKYSKIFLHLEGEWTITYSVPDWGLLGKPLHDAWAEVLKGANKPKTKTTKAKVTKNPQTGELTLVSTQEIS